MHPRVMLVALAIMLLRAGALQAQAPSVYGTVFSNQRGPLAGITVSLVHPNAGRSAPALSAANGYFYFVNVPPQPTPYFIEAYWGSQLLFRSQVAYQGYPIQFDIPLP